MNDDIRLDINELMNLLDTKKMEFDQWLDKQIENLRLMKSQQEKEKAEHEKQVKQINMEKINIEKEIKKAEQDKEKCISKRNEIQAQQNQLEKEISEIPQDFDFYKNKIYLLEMKANRIQSANAKQTEIKEKTISELEAYESLFGVSIRVDNGTTTFTFSNPKSKVVISEISNKYQFLEIPRELSLYQRSIMDDFNNDKNLFKFVSSIRSHLS